MPCVYVCRDDYHRECCPKILTLLLLYMSWRLSDSVLPMSDKMFKRYFALMFCLLVP